MSPETMSGESKGAEAVTANAQAAEWIERRDRDEWNETDRLALDAWLAQSPAHRAAFWRLEAAWKDTNRLTAFKPALRPRREAKPAASRIVFKSVAAAVFVAACGIGAATYMTTPDWKTYSTTIGGREILTLGDGTKIELNTDSSVRVAQTASARHVWLDKGEAYFDVTHNAARPFTVTVGDRRITDLGTKFVVRRETQQMKVAVLDGRVQLEEKNGHAAVLTRGDIVVATAGRLVRSHAPAKQIESDLGWRTGVLVFDDRTLADVADEFNRYNTRKLIVTGNAAQTRIAGTFRADNIDAFANTAHRVLGLKVERRGQEILISH
jgi:transmembrane sensor